MKINLSPQRRDENITVEVAGDRIRINGELFNFNPLEEGGRIRREDVPCDFLVSDVERIDGEVTLTLILPHGPNPSRRVAFPEPIHVTEDGPVDLPSDPVADPEPEIVDEEEQDNVDA